MIQKSHSAIMGQPNSDWINCNTKMKEIFHLPTRSASVSRRRSRGYYTHLGNGILISVNQRDLRERMS